MVDFHNKIRDRFRIRRLKMITYFSFFNTANWWKATVAIT